VALMTVVWVMVAGGIGSGARYLVGQWASQAIGASFPYGTLLVNLIGSVPRTEDVLAIPGAHLHLYGKEPRPGRKLGHITLVEPTQASEDAVRALL